MKTKLKYIFFLAAISLAATACGGSMAKPVSGLDVSLLSPSLLTISPKTDENREVNQVLEQRETNAKTEVFENQQLKINNLQ